MKRVCGCLPSPPSPHAFPSFFSHALTLLLLLLLCVACMGGSHGETCGRAWGDRGKNHVGGCIYLAQWMALVPLSLFWNLTPLGLFTCSTLWFFFFSLLHFCRFLLFLFSPLLRTFFSHCPSTHLYFLLLLFFFPQLFSVVLSCPEKLKGTEESSFFHTLHTPMDMKGEEPHMDWG